MTQKTVDDYLLMVTSQYQNSPKFLEWLRTIIEMCDGVRSCINDMYIEFDLDSASGTQLDILGIIIGQSRFLNFDPPDGTLPKLGDVDYRKVLKLKTFTNYWDGNIDSLYEAWNKVFIDCSLLIDDNQDMSANITLTGKLTDMIKEMIYRDLILPRPEGVQYFYTGVAPTTNNLFCYDYDDEGHPTGGGDVDPIRRGYDVGYWDVTI